MAESLVDGNIIMVTHQEIEAKSMAPDVDLDIAEFDDSSSGSDRSFETYDTDGNSRGEDSTGPSGHHVNTDRKRRKRRHGSHGSRRHKGGSRHKHKKGYQPYPSKDDIETQLKRKSLELELQEKENAAAVVRRDGGDQFISFPVAPFNSTQFLMDEHSAASSPANFHKTPSSSVLNSCSPQDIRFNSVSSTLIEPTHEMICLEKKDKEFSEIFTSAHAESLQSLPKEELVKHYMNLEEKVAALQKKVAEQQQRQYNSSSSNTDGSAVGISGYDSVCYSDTESFSSSPDEFVDQPLPKQSSIIRSDPEILKTLPVPSSSSSDFQVICADTSS